MQSRLRWSAFFVTFATWPLFFACADGEEDISCETACNEIVEKYGECREDLNGPESCTDSCDGGEAEKEVMRVHSCLEDHDYACDAFSDECRSDLFIRIVVQADDPRDIERRGTWRDAARAYRRRQKAT